MTDDVCTWRNAHDPEVGDYWISDCGLTWAFSFGGGPSENEWGYCPKCGNRLIERMNLYVCGEDSPYPDQWSAWSEYDLVLAENIEQVKELTNKEPILQVDMSKPAILCIGSEPQWGDDL